MDKIDDILKEFERKWNDGDFDSENRYGESWTCFEGVNHFLRQALQQQEEKLLDKAHQESCNGVSQWMNYGKKRGYFDFFEDKNEQEKEKHL